MKELRMELIQRYIYAIEKRLPSSGRDDIAKEINSIIMDELEGKFGKKAEYTKEEIESVLIEMGHPREVAARYRGDKQYLIGPDLMHFYKMVLGIVLGAVTLGLVISFIVGRFGAEAGAWDTVLDFLELLGSIFSALLGAVGGVTITFALIERFGKFNKKDLDINEGWKPKDLPEMPQESERVRMWEPIFAITMTVIWAVFINTYAFTGGVPFFENLNSEMTILPIFSIEAVKHLLPLWNISILMTIVLQMILLKKGKWQLGTRIFEIAISLLGIAILAVMYTGPMLLSVEGFSTVFPNSIEFAASIEKYYYLGIKVIMIISAIGIVVNVIKLIVKQARKANI